MPAKKTAKKKVAKTVESMAAATPRERKSINDVILFLRNNPEFAIAFHKHFEDKVFQLNRAGWACGAEYADKKHVWGAQCITTEILDEFNFYDLVRK